MKLQKVSEKEIKTGAPVVAGVVGGALVGRGIIAIAVKPVDAKAVTQAEKNKKMYVKAGLLLAGAYGYMAVEGADIGSLVVKNLALGIALSSAVGLIDDHAKDSTTIQAKLVADTTANRFLKATIGLGCPCDIAPAPTPIYGNPTMPLNKPRHHRRHLGNPFYQDSPMSMLPTQNVFEKAYAKGL